MSAVKRYIDYYPFGALMPGRNTNADLYRYGQGGKEGDSEIKGTGNSMDYGARMYDPRLGRWLSLDPLALKYPDLSAYCYVANMPIIAIDIDGQDIGIVVTSMAKSPGGAGKHGHMAIIVGNDEIGWWVFSLEQPANRKTYIKDEEIIFKTDVNEIEKKISKIDYTVFYGHKEATKEDLLKYMSEYAPGINNDKENQGFGYDRIATLKNITPEHEAEFLKFLQNQKGTDFIYEAATSNCSSMSMDLINQFFNNIINDKTKVDRPNNEFDKIKKDTEQWEILKDEKKEHDEQRSQNRKESKKQKQTQNEKPSFY